MVLTPVFGEAATTSWPLWRRMATVFEPIRPVPPMTTIFMVDPPLSTTGPCSTGCSPRRARRYAHERKANADVVYLFRAARQGEANRLRIDADQN
jgi:hypothetical protein